MAATQLTDENTLTQELRFAWSHLDVRFKDRYAHTKVQGDDVGRFVDLYKEDCRAQGASYDLKWLDHDTVAVK